MISSLLARQVSSPPFFPNCKHLVIHLHTDINTQVQTHNAYTHNLENSTLHMFLLNEDLSYVSHLLRCLLPGRLITREEATPSGMHLTRVHVRLWACFAAALSERREGNTLSFSPAVRWRNLSYVSTRDYIFFFFFDQKKNPL